MHIQTIGIYSSHSDSEVYFKTRRQRTEVEPIQSCPRRPYFRCCNLHTHHQFHSQTFTSDVGMSGRLLCLTGCPVSTAAEEPVDGLRADLKGMNCRHAVTRHPEPRSTLNGKGTGGSPTETRTDSVVADTISHFRWIWGGGSMSNYA